jgi:hypothetical protein
VAYAFLSSPVLGLRDLRVAIRGNGLPDGHTVWVDEIDHPLTGTEPTPYTLDRLFREIQAASIFVVLLGTERHGTPLTWDDQTAHVSFWEAELFYAALLRKPIRVFEVVGFEPDEKLAAVLRLLRRALPASDWSGPHARDRVASAVRGYLVEQIEAEDRRVTAPKHFLGDLVDALLHLRGKDGRGGAAETEALTFLDGSFADATVVPNEALIRKLLEDIKSLSHEETRLTRLWVVFRELSGAPFATTKRLEYLPYWNAFFREWASAGSWYGLHGHPQLAVLPALVAQTKVRAQMRASDSSAWQEEDTRYPGGELASARYSIAGKCRNGRSRRFLLRAALADLNRSLVPTDPSTLNLLAVRGSVYRRLGAIGRAVDDYETVLRHRRHSGENDASIGEALSELGYGYLFQLRLWRGLSHLKEGVRLLESDKIRPGFLIRATRKLAVAYAVTGHPFKARETLRAARDLAQQHGVWDQIR